MRKENKRQEKRKSVLMEALHMKKTVAKREVLDTRQVEGERINTKHPPSVTSKTGSYKEVVWEKDGKEEGKNEKNTSWRGRKIKKRTEKVNRNTESRTEQLV